MKKLIIALGVAGVLIFGAFAVVTIGSSGTAAAQSDAPQSDTPEPEVQTTTDTDVPEWVDEVLNGLVTGGIITQDSADQLREEAPGVLGMLEQMQSDADSDGDEGFLPFDIERFRDRFESFGFSDGLDGLDLFGPDGFSFQDLTEQFENFNFQMPEGLEHPEGITPESFGSFRFPGAGLGFLDDISGLSFDELRQALQDGTLADLIDFEAIISDATDRLDAAVADGDLTRDRADDILSKLTEKLDAVANGEVPSFGGAPHGENGSFGFGRLHPQADTDAPANT